MIFLSSVRDITGHEPPGQYTDIAVQYHWRCEAPKKASPEGCRKIPVLFIDNPLIRLFSRRPQEVLT
jgi:hypothetical protein